MNSRIAALELGAKRLMKNADEEMLKSAQTAQGINQAIARGAKAEMPPAIDANQIAESVSQKLAQQKPGLVRRAGNWVGGALKSPLIVAAPFVLPMMMGGGEDQTGAVDPAMMMAMQQQPPSIDPVTKAMMQQQMMNQSVAGYMGGM